MIKTYIFISFLIIFNVAMRIPLKRKQTTYTSNGKIALENKALLFRCLNLSQISSNFNSSILGG